MTDQRDGMPPQERKGDIEGHDGYAQVPQSGLGPVTPPKPAPAPVPPEREDGVRCTWTFQKDAGAPIMRCVLDASHANHSLGVPQVPAPEREKPGGGEITGWTSEFQSRVNNMDAAMRLAHQRGVEAANRQAAEWHEAVGQQKADAANRGLVAPTVVNRLRGQAHAHNDSAAHFRALTPQSQEPEKGSGVSLSNLPYACLRCGAPMAEPRRACGRCTTGPAPSPPTAEEEEEGNHEHIWGHTMCGVCGKPKPDPERAALLACREALRLLRESPVVSGMREHIKHVHGGVDILSAVDLALAQADRVVEK